MLLALFTFRGDLLSLGLLGEPVGLWVLLLLLLLLRVPIGFKLLLLLLLILLLLLHERALVLLNPGVGMRRHFLLVLAQVMELVQVIVKAACLI